jgi:hypothetical protein
MSLKQLNHKIIMLGNGLLSRIKYGFSFSYDQYDFIKTLHEKEQKTEIKTHKTLYKIK